MHFYEAAYPGQSGRSVIPDVSVDGGSSKWVWTFHPVESKVDFAVAPQCVGVIYSTQHCCLPLNAVRI